MSRCIGVDVGAHTIKAVLLGEGRVVEEEAVEQVRGKPMEALIGILRRFREAGAERVCLGVTGAGGKAVAECIGVQQIDESTALAAAFGLLYPEVRTVVEMGRESQKLVAFARDERTGRLLVTDVNLGSKCAAGTGSFLDHMHRRLNYRSIDEFAQVAVATDNPASLSGRCAVFTESDIVHLYQKGTSRERIVAGIHHAICRNYRSNIAKGRALEGKVAFIGGVSRNPGVVKYMQQELNLDGNALLVPEHNLTMSAIGAALRAAQEINLDDALAALRERAKAPFTYVGTSPLVFGQVEILPPPQVGELPRRIDVAALGVDIGSVSTKAALITEVDGEVRVLASYYRRTEGDPLRAVRDTIGRIRRQAQEAGFEIGQIFAATTGSGRYLTGDYIGADVIKNEITSQAHGALAFIPDVDAIFEIGGQDSKFVRIDNGVIIDFEMNKACAAGTGAFLEKMAGHLGLDINDFGDTALRGTNPPDLDWQCTVFSESAMIYYQQNNVPIEDLAAGTCLASVKNYLNKNVGSRDIGEKIAFQGAVAFNKGMAAAFETVLGRKIIVPPYPHLTGAIGAARLAYRERPAESRFRGFDAITEGQYTVTSFGCKGCPNHCDVNVFQMDGGPKYFYNDRCEKYSGVTKKSLGEGLPDLFQEREDLLYSVYTRKAPAGAKRVGYPQGLLFSEYFPLFNAFFTELGFEVVPTRPTSKRTIELGVQTTVAEPCFPIKVAHGHVAEALQQDIDYLFLPGILSTELPNPKLPQAQTCPYLQAAPELFLSALRGRQRQVIPLTPRLFFNRGRTSLRRALVELAVEQLGRTPGQAEAALEVGLNALNEFRRRIAERGREVLENLGEQEVAFVVCGRPYALYDRAVNMDIGKKIQDLGILAIPQDFLPLDEVDISDHWPNAYSRQVAKKLAAARLVRGDARLRAVVITYFGCGPDSFANPFLRDEIGEPCYVMQIDEHTADAGVITRIEAFADTARVPKKGKPPAAFSTRRTLVQELEGKTLWIPYACEQAHILAATMQVYGVNAQVLPRSPDPTMTLARSNISEDVCLPALVTTEDQLYRATRPDFDPQKEAFFQGQSEGPCRFGMYYALQSRILDKLGYPTAMVTLGSRDHEGGLGTAFAMVAWDGLVTHDLLEKMMLHTRPYEQRPGDSERIFRDYVRETCDLLEDHRILLESRKGKALAALGLHLSAFEDLLHRAQREFERVPKRDEDRPLVGVVGEWFVRLHTGANQDIVKKLEAAGAEVWLAPATEFFSYANRIAFWYARSRWQDCRDYGDFGEMVRRYLLDSIARRDEHRLYQATLPYTVGLDDIDSVAILARGARYVHPSFGGEAICSMAKADDFARRGMAGVVNVIPFNCMPGVTVHALGQELRREYDNLPFLTLDYDGFVDAGRDAKIAAFMAQVKERHAARKGGGWQ
jgi:predicted CoA-substrate-specific enzyme activase